MIVQCARRQVCFQLRAEFHFARNQICQAKHMVDEMQQALKPEPAANILPYCSHALGYAVQAAITVAILNHAE